MTDFTKELKELGIKQLLNLLKESSGNIKEKIKQVIKEKINSKNYLISLSEEETKSLYNITKSEIYKRMEECLGSHWAMNLIALGLYVTELNKVQQEELQNRVRDEVHKRYSGRGLRILEMGSTGAIKNIIDYLSGIKIRKNYDFIQIGKLFDKIIEEWERITIFIKSEDTYTDVEIKILNTIGNKIHLFFVFAYGSAVRQTYSTIAKLNNNGNLKGCLFEGKCVPEDPNNRNSKEVYSCYFESVEGFGIDVYF